MQVILNRSVKIAGKIYEAGADITNVDQGSVESLLNCEWAQIVEEKLDTDPIELSDKVNNKPKKKS